MSIEYGKYNDLPHYSVIGEPTNFYIWVNENGKGDSSSWIKGKKAFAQYYELKSLHQKNKSEFVKKIKEVFHQHRKGTH